MVAWTGASSPRCLIRAWAALADRSRRFRCP
jgi:hypothetical protein